MLKYLYNPDFFDAPEILRDYISFSWMFVLLLIILLRRYKDPVHLRLFYFVLYSVLMEYFSSNKSLSLLFGDVGTSPMYHLLTPGLFFFMSYIYADFLYWGKYQRFGVGLFFAFCLTSLAVVLWWGLAAFPTIPVCFYSTTGIFLSVIYFLRLLNKLDVEYLEREPMFWIATGLLIYFSGNFLIWIAYNFLTYDKEFFFSIYNINTMLTSLLHLFLVAAIIINPGHTNNDTINQIA